MHLNTSLSSICPSLKFKWCPLAFPCPIKEMPPDVTHCDDRFPYNLLVFLLFPWLPVDTCNISSWCCAVGDKNPPPIPFHRLKSPCWVDPTAASSLSKVIRRTGRVDDHARAHLAVSRGYVGGAWWVVSPAPFCARPTSHDFDWNDCALLGVRSRWSDLMTHDPNRKKQVQTGPEPIRRQTFQTEKKKIIICAEMVNMHLQHVTGRKIVCVALWTSTNESQSKPCTGQYGSDLLRSAIMLLVYVLQVIRLSIGCPVCILCFAQS